MIRPPLGPLALAGALLLGGGLAAGCAPSAAVPPPPADVAVSADPRWSDVQPVLAANCASCHGGERPAAGLDLTSWDGAVAGSEHGHALIAYDPARSPVIRLASQLPEALPDGYAWRHTIPYEAFREAHRLGGAELEALRAWIAAGARNDAGRAPFEEMAGRVYVALQDAGMVAVVDAERHVVARTVTFEPFGGVAATPHDTEVEPDGSAWYVTLINAQRLVKLDARTNEVTGVLDVRPLNATYKPGMLAVDPHSDRLYLSRSISDLSGGRSILFVDRRAMEAEEVAVPYTRPHPIGLTADGRFVLSGSLADNLAAAIDAETLDLSPPLRVDETQTPLMHYDVAPDGRTAVVTGQFSNRLYVLDLSDPANLTLRGSVEVGQEPWYPGFAPDSRRVFVPDHRSNTVSVVDVEAMERIAVIEHPAFAMPHGAAVSADGRYAFVSNGNLRHVVAPEPARRTEGREDPPLAPPPSYQPRYPFDRDGDGRADNLQAGHLAVIDAQTYEVIRILELEEFPSGLSIWPRAADRR